MGSRRSPWIALPAAAAALVYAISLGSGFVYDDEALIRTNHWVHDASALPHLLGRPLLASPPMGTTNYYRPLVVTLYNLCWQIGGGSPAAFHTQNVALHMLNATLVFFLVRRFSRDATAAGAAVLFAVHPLNVEVVAWASGLPELTYAALGLSALLLHLASWERTGAAARRSRAAAWVAFGLACSCKETALVFLPLIVLAERWLRAGDPARRPGWARASRAAVPYLIPAAIYFAARFAVLGGWVAQGAHARRTLFDAVWNAPWLLFRYLRFMAFPSPLLIEHAITLARGAADPRFVLGLLGVGAGAYGVVRLAVRNPVPAFATCLTVLPILPALYVPALGRDPFAERYAYLGVVGFTWLIVAGLDGWLASTRPAAPRTAPAIVAAIAVVLAIRSIARERDWKNDGTLGSASMRDEPRAAIGYLLAGDWAKRQGDKVEALRNFEAGVARIPDSLELQQESSALGIELGRGSEDKIDAYARLAASAPASASTQFNLGQVLLDAGRLDEAASAFERALALEPRSVQPLTALAVVASRRGDAAGAIAYCRRALAIDERSVPAWQQLGVALSRSGDDAGAVSALERAVALAPDEAEGLSRLGALYAKSGRIDDARRVLRRALELDPGLASARQNLDRVNRMAP